MRVHYSWHLQAVTSVFNQLGFCRLELVICRSLGVTNFALKSLIRICTHDFYVSVLLPIFQQVQITHTYYLYSLSHILLTMHNSKGLVCAPL